MWDPIRSARLRHELVKHLCAERAIRSREVEEAFLVVPREYFLPHTPLDQVYQDAAIVVKRVDGEPRSSSSQPALMADMLEVLRLQAGLRVLEIGAGTGYNAALLARLVGHPSRVVTVDIDPEMAAAARQHLARAGFPEVQVVGTDGAGGYPPRSPYDRIIVTVQQYDLSPAWVDQLVDGGILLVPVTIVEALRLSLIPAFRKEGRWLIAQDGSLGGFMPMQGEMAHPRLPEAIAALGTGPPDEALILIGPSPKAQRFFEALVRASGGPLRPVARERLGSTLDLQQQGGLALLLGLEIGQRAFRLRSGHPRFGFSGPALGLISQSERGATVITTGELVHYGDTEAAPEVHALLQRWASLGCPSQRDFPVLAAPVEEALPPARLGWRIERRHYHFLICPPG